MTLHLTSIDAPPHEQWREQLAWAHISILAAARAIDDAKEKLELAFATVHARIAAPAATPAPVAASDVDPPLTSGEPPATVEPASGEALTHASPDGQAVETWSPPADDEDARLVAAQIKEIASIRSIYELRAWGLASDPIQLAQRLTQKGRVDLHEKLSGAYKARKIALEGVK